MDKKGITKTEDAFAYSSFTFWATNEKKDIIDDKKIKNCLSFKCDEYLFCKQSKDYKLGFTAELNWGSQYQADIFLRNGKYGYVAADYKLSQTAFHIAFENQWGITAHNWISLKLKQIEEYCNDGLRYIVYERRINPDTKENRKAQSYLKAFNWNNSPEVLEKKKTIIIIDVPKLCNLIDTNEEVIFQTVPEHLRDYEINGKNWDGKTVCCNYNIWSSYEVE